MKKRLSDLIQSYLSCGMKEEYEGTLSFEMAASCHFQNRKGVCVKRPHQRKYVSNAVLFEYANRLIECRVDLERCFDFESLIRIVDEERIKGIGPLTLYDVAVAIGYIQQPKILPEQFAYLHAGAEKGYNALVAIGLLPPCIKGKMKRMPIKVFDCLKELQVLDPKKHEFPQEVSYAMLVEDFLCVKHKELEELSTR